MKTRYKFVLIALIVVILSFAIHSYGARLKPYDSWPSNHVDELKQIPEVAAFYSHYEDYGVTVFADGVISYQIGFQAIEGQRKALLKVNYFFGVPFSFSYSCWDGDSGWGTSHSTLSVLIKEKHCFSGIMFEGKTLDYWKGVDFETLIAIHSEKGDQFFYDLGAFLTKDYFEEKLAEHGIKSEHEIEPKFSGVRESLPPDISYGATVNATDGKIYRLTVPVNGNVIREDYFRISEAGTWKNEN